MRHLKRHLIRIMMLSLLASGYGCVQNIKSGCMWVEIESAGGYCVESERVIAVAPAPHNHPKGMALSISLSPPIDSSGERNDDISRIALSADVRPRFDLVCSHFINFLGERKLNCVASIPDKRLHVIVTFDDDKALGRYEERTQLIADDVVSNVIKEWKPRK
ncbi:MAG: hypothetical protein EPO31_05200 [Gammaproteobacteria bacterium]|nr:MAG: hypothetical protein EPO31_05200 [Gammaproteobacteria bacterium]